MYDSLSYNAALVSQFLDERAVLHDARNLALTWIGTPAAWALGRLLAQCHAREVPLSEAHEPVKSLSQDDDVGPVPLGYVRGLCVWTVSACFCLEPPFLLHAPPPHTHSRSRER